MSTRPIIVMYVDTGNMPPKRAMELMDHYARGMNDLLADETKQVLVLPDKSRVEVLNVPRNAKVRVKRS